MADVKYMDLNEFRDDGYLQELNRLFLHPLGLAMEILVDDDGTVTGLGGIWDYRDDPEGINYQGFDLTPKAENIARVSDERLLARVKALGYWVQPVGDAE